MSDLLQRTLAFLVLSGCLSGLIWIATERTGFVYTERISIAGMAVGVLFLSVWVSARKLG